MDILNVCVSLCVCACVNIQVLNLITSTIIDLWYQRLGTVEWIHIQKSFCAIPFWVVVVAVAVVEGYQIWIYDNWLFDLFVGTEGRLTYIHRQNTDVFRVYRKTFIIFAMHVCMYRGWLTKRIRIWYIVLKGNPLGNHKSWNFHSLFIPVKVVRCVVILSLTLLKIP